MVQQSLCCLSSLISPHAGPHALCHKAPSLLHSSDRPRSLWPQGLSNCLCLDHSSYLHFLVSSSDLSSNKASSWKSITNSPNLIRFPSLIAPFIVSLQVLLSLDVLCDFFYKWLFLNCTFYEGRDPGCLRFAVGFSTRHRAFSKYLEWMKEGMNSLPNRNPSHVWR